jgi:hypothetical protein
MYCGFLPGIILGSYLISDETFSLMIKSCRQALIIIAILGLTCTIAGCLSSPALERKVINGTGTLYLPDLFGSALRIESDHGIIYTPATFPDIGFKNGMKVEFIGAISQNPYYPIETTIPLDLILLHPLPGTKGPVYGTGTVTHVDIEGGFFGITVDTKGQGGTIRYYPLDLDKEFQVDGLMISFSGEEQPDVVTTSQWGTPLFLTRVRPVG